MVRQICENIFATSFVLFNFFVGKNALVRMVGNQFITWSFIFLTSIALFILCFRTMRKWGD